MELSKSVHKKRISHRFGEDIPTIRVQKYYLHFYHVHVRILICDYLTNKFIWLSFINDKSNLQSWLAIKHKSASYSIDIVAIYDTMEEQLPSHHHLTQNEHLPLRKC